MKQMQKKNKIVLVALTVGLILLRIIYLWNDFEIRGEYWHSSEFLPENSVAIPFENISQTFIAENEKLNRLEFIFADIPENAEGIIKLTIESEQKLVYGSQITISNLVENVWYPLDVNLCTEKGGVYEIRLTATDMGQMPRIYIVDEDMSAPESTICSIDGESSDKPLQIHYGYQKQISIADNFLRTFEFILYCFGAYWFLCILKRNCSKIQRCLETYFKTSSCSQTDIKVIAMEMILSFILVEKGNFIFDGAVKTVLYTLSFASCLGISKRFEQIKESYLDKRIKIGFVVLNLYAAFSLVGNRLFLYPINKTVTVGDFFIYVVAVLWFAPILFSGIFFYEKIRPQVYRCSGKGTLRFGILITFALLVPSIFALYAFNPGISSYDSIACLAEYAHNIWNMQDWHPPFYVMLLQGIIALWDSTYAVIFAQFIFWTFALLELFLFLRRRGWSEGGLLVIAIMMGSNAGNFLHLCSIWKDIPYAISLLWLSVLIGKITLESDYYRDKKYVYIELVIALVFTCLLRQNGIIPYILTAGLLGIVLHKNRRIVFSVSISFLVIVLIKGPVYDYIGVQKANSGGMYIGLGQDILGVYYAGGDLSEETMEIVNGLTDNNTGEFEYTPYYAKSSYDLDIKMTDFIKEYLITFIRNPVMMTRVILCRQDALWGIYDGEYAFVGCVNYHETMEGNAGWARYYPERIENYYTAKMSKLTEYSALNPLLRILEWRAGLPLLLVFIAVFCMMRKQADIKNYLVLVPLFGQSLSLVLSTGWSDFRYYWPVNLISVFIILLVPTIQNEIKTIEISGE